MSYSAFENNVLENPKKSSLRKGSALSKSLKDRLIPKYFSRIFLNFIIILVLEYTPK